MRRIHGLIICTVVLWASNLFADCNWVLWQSRKFVNPAARAAAFSLGRLPMPQEIMLEKWEYLDAFQNKKECRVAREENLNTLISTLKVRLKKKRDEEINNERANEEAAKHLHLPLDKRFPAFEHYIDTQRALGRNDKDIEPLILKQIEQIAKKKKVATIEIRVDEDGSVHGERNTYKFKCIPSTIDPRIKG